tara:strand:- start:1851 stop:3959 length:2109 start_codon:yes stop_codon:yes gene_type:complete
MATKQEKWQAIADRGLQDKFDPATRAKFDEAVNRGLITMPVDVQQEGAGVAVTPRQQIQPIQDGDWMPTDANLSIQQPVKPERTWGEVAEGVGETALTLGTGATTGALGFLGGSIEAAIGKLTGGLTEEEAIKLIQERSGGMTNMPESEAGQEYVKWVGDKLGALPPVLGTPAATGLRGVGRVVPASRAAEAAELKSFVSQGFEPKQFKWNKSFSDAQKKEQLNKALASGDKEGLSAMIDADPEFFKAMDELGVQEKGLPSAASKNRQYQETEQALKKIPGSDLSKKEFDQVSELQKISDDLITEFGGTTDKSALSMDLLRDSDKAIDNLSVATEAAYTNIGDNIPKQTISTMDSIGGYVKTELENLGGDKSQLSSLEKRLLAMSENGATYHAIDKIRKEVGNTLGKKSMKYADEDTGALNRIYAKLTDDQEVVANEFGMGDAWAGAKDLVIMRKDLEDNSIKMFGKNLSEAFMPKMGLAMKKLTDGDYKKFNELMDSVPVSKRQEVIVSALNDVFTMGSRKEKQLNVAGYADWMNGLNKNPRLKKEIYSQLPKGLGVKLDAMGKVTNGIRNAQAAAPVGGQVMASSKVLDKVVNGVASRFLTRLPGIVGDLATVGLDKSKSKNMDAALAVLGDPDFVANISALAKGQAKKAAMLEKRLMNKKTFKHFASTLSPKEAKAIGVLGLTSWLARSDEKQDDTSAP